MLFTCEVFGPPAESKVVTFVRMMHFFVKNTMRLNCKKCAKKLSTYTKELVSMLAFHYNKNSDLIRNTLYVL